MAFLNSSAIVFEGKNEASWKFLHHVTNSLPCEKFY
jgi:hypothetical protein